MRLWVFAFTASLCLAQPGAPREGEFEKGPAILIDNGKLQLAVSRQGASLVDLTLHEDPDRLSPLWNPARMAREANQPQRFGAGRGHFVCVDGFGGVSPEERAAGLMGHGEAHRQTMEIIRSGREGAVSAVSMSAKLPLLQENFTRTVRMVDGENVVYVESELENQLSFDRPVNWAEHATIGSPFLEPGVTVVDHSGTRSRTRPHESGGGALQQRLTSAEDFTWPAAPGLDGSKIDLRATPEKLGYLDHSTTLMDPSRPLAWVIAFHPTKRLLLGYLFRREEYPWMQYWGNYPLNGKLARGLEFGTQPFDVPRREAISMGKLFDTPTFRWLPAKSKIQTKFLMFYVAAPEGFGKVDDVRFEDGHIVIQDRSAGRQMKLRASLGI